jgi:hypothetical protein
LSKKALAGSIHSILQQFFGIEHPNEYIWKLGGHQISARLDANGIHIPKLARNNKRDQHVVFHICFVPVYPIRTRLRNKIPARIRIHIPGELCHGT